MKKLFYVIFSLFLISTFSCKKSESVKSAGDTKSPVTANNGGSRLRTNLFNSGGTAALTLQSNGTYTATWGGANLVFSGISTPPNYYKFGDGINGYSVSCTNGTIVSNAGSYFVGSVNVMSQADVNFILQRTNAYNTKLTDFQQAIKKADGSYKQGTLPNFFNEVMVGGSTSSNPFSGGVIYDPGVSSHLSVTTSAFVATIPNTTGVLLFLGELYKGNTRLRFYSNSNADHHITQIDAFDTSNNPVDVYSVSGFWKTITGSGGLKVTGSLIIGNSNNTPTTFDDMVYLE